MNSANMLKKMGYAIIMHASAYYVKSLGKLPSRGRWGRHFLFETCSPCTLVNPWITKGSPVGRNDNKTFLQAEYGKICIMYETEGLDFE